MSFGIQAQNKIPPRQKAREVIRKTATVIQKARNQLKQNKNYTGHLSKAVRHQKFAKAMFKQGKYGKAIQHSRRARQLAIESIRLNKGVVEKNMQLEKKETNDESIQLKPEDLEKELPMEDLKEEDIITAGELDIDIKENE